MGRMALNPWEDYLMKLKAALLGAAAVAMLAGTASAAELACLITKNNTNPFFTKPVKIIS